MKAQQNRHLQSFRRASHFVASLPAGTASPAFAPALAQLDAVIAALTGHAVAQQGTRRLLAAGHARMRALRDALRQRHLAPALRAAHALGDENPELGALRMPDRNAGVERLLQETEAVAAVLERNAPALVAHGFPATFVADLRAAASAVRETVDERGARRVDGAGATAGVREQIDRGRRAVLLLDALVQRALHDDAGRLAEWRQAIRIGREGAGGRASRVPAAGDSTSAPVARAA
jgi:hypothetical protein